MSSEKEAGQVLTSENAADFYAQKMSLADQGFNEAEVEDSPSEPSDKGSRSEPGADKNAKSAEERKQNPKLEKRFSEITKQREQARQEAAQEREVRQRLEAQLAAVRQQQQPQQVRPADGKPQPSQFTDAFEYAESLADWSAEQALGRRDREDLERRADEARQKVISTWAQKVATAKSDIPDFDDMVASSGVAVSDPIRDAILESDVGPQILYHLAKEDDLAKKIASMSPFAALREIGKLEAKFETQTQTRQSNPVGKSKAPPPISPIRNAGGAKNAEIGSDGQFHGSYQAWKEARKAGRIR